MQQALSVKEQNRRKLAEARKRDAEKYGEEYVEVTDDDLK
jgi:YidC/Oxa1 family membrane protein insertase